MCSNYRPVTRMDRLLTFFGVERERDEVPADVFPTGLAPFIRRSGDAPVRVVEHGAFGLLPSFAKEVAFGKHTYNARTETVARLPSFRQAWSRGQRCIVPAEGLFEPRYFGTAERPGRSERWRVGLPGDVPMGIAGIYETWRNPHTGQDMFSFSMLTVNADDHPVYSLLQKPGDEKRMAVILDPGDYDAWLACTPAQASQLFRQWAGPLDLAPAALPPRAPVASAGKATPPPAPAPPDQGELPF